MLAPPRDQNPRAYARADARYRSKRDAANIKLIPRARMLIKQRRETRVEELSKRLPEFRRRLNALSRYIDKLPNTR